MSKKKRDLEDDHSIILSNKFLDFNLDDEEEELDSILCWGYDLDANTRENVKRLPNASITQAKNCIEEEQEEEEWELL